MKPQIFDCKCPGCPGKAKYEGYDPVTCYVPSSDRSRTELREAEVYLECNGPEHHILPYTVKIPVRRSS
jgi:hypothetical protein